MLSADNNSNRNPDEGHHVVRKSKYASATMLVVHYNWNYSKKNSGLLDRNLDESLGLSRAHFFDIR